MAAARVPKKSAERTKSVRSLVKDAFQLTIECVICTETKELRQLPCQHTMCYDCLDRVISGARGQGLQPACSFCKAKLTGKAGDYPVCRLAANLRTELEQLEKTLSTSPYKRSTTDKSQLCESGECQRHIDRYCKRCELYFCYSCSKCSCKDHTKDLVEFDELIKASEEKYERWRAQKMTQIDCFKEKEKKLATEFKEQVVKASDTDISGMLESLSVMKESIQAATNVVAEETRVYEQHESDIRGVTAVEFMRLVEQLSIEDKVEVSDKDKDMAAIKLRQPSRRQSSHRQSSDISKDSDVESIKLVEQIPAEKSNSRTQKRNISVRPVSRVGEETPFDATLKTRQVIMSDLCSHVTDTADGKILVGLSNGFCEYNSMGVIVKSVSTKDSAVISLQHYETNIFTISNCGETSRLEIYDRMSYKRIIEWPLLFPAYKLAVSTNKVYVTDRGSKHLHRFGLFGEPLKPFTHSTFQSPFYITKCSTDSILISDYSANKVHRMNTQTDQMMWTCTITSPDAICCADNGNAWIFSHHIKSLFVLKASTGKLRKELTHPMFAEDGSSVFGIHVETTDPGLWTAGRHGLSKLSLGKNISCEALYDFNAEEEGDVSFMKGDIISNCTEQDSSGWSTGYVMRTGLRGHFERSYVTELPVALD